jgi:hypothetical protein
LVHDALEAEHLGPIEVERIGLPVHSTAIGGQAASGEAGSECACSWAAGETNRECGGAGAAGAGLAEERVV